MRSGVSVLRARRVARVATTARVATLATTTRRMEAVEDFSDVAPVQSGIHIVLYAADNFGYVIESSDNSTTSSDNKSCVVIDAGHNSSALLLATAARLQCRIAAVHCTHRHADHTADAHLLAQCVTVGATQQTQSNYDALTVVAIPTPCHTKESAVLYLPQRAAAFTGDTLFACGCGRFFEGTAHDMCKAFQAIAQLPPDTALYFGHEYLMSNLKFARHLLPDCPLLAAREEWAQKRLKEGKHCCPIKLSTEMAENPFFRLKDANLRRALDAENDSDEEVMRKLREAKNNFKA